MSKHRNEEEKGTAVLGDRFSFFHIRGAQATGIGTVRPSVKRLLIGIMMAGGLMVVACGLTGGSEVGTRPTPTESLAETTIEKAIPAGYQIPPSDVLQQIMFYTGGASLCGRHSVVNGNRLLLWGHEPYQELRVLVYKRSGPVGRFVTEWSVIVDSSGRMRLEMSGSDSEDYEFIVADADSGHILEWGHLCSDDPVVPGGGWGPGSQVVAHRLARQLDIRAGPGNDHRVVTQVSGDQIMTIQANPHVVDGERWWLVSLDGGRGGWVSESWLAPLPTSE